MNFLNPLLLLGLIAVAVPIVLHLINLRRPQKVVFSTLSFFQELRKSTIRRIRIKQYLLMAIRALALLLLGLALARPFIPPTLTGTTSSGEARAIALIVDNSASMSRVGNQGPLIDQAKDVANRIIRNGNSDDQFLVAATNSNTDGGAGLVSGIRARELIAEISAENTAHYTAGALREAYRQLQESPLNQAIIYVISDGQQSQLSDLEKLDIEPGENTKPVSLQLISLEQARQQNIAVTSLKLNSQMLSQGAPVSLAVEVENVGEAAVANQFVSLQFEGELQGQYELSLQPGETREFTFQLTPEEVGDRTGQIILEGDEVNFDNTRYFVIRVPETRSVLLINDEDRQSSFRSYLSPALEAARQTNAQLSFQEKTVSEVDQSHWEQYDAVVFDGIEQVPEYWFKDLQQFVQKGRGILFFPSEKGDVQNYNSFFSLFNGGQFNDVIGEYASFKPVVEVAELEEGHPVLNDLFAREKDESISVDLPSLFYYYHYDPPSNSGSLDVLTAANGDPLLTEQKFGEGVVLISSFGADPGWSNFPVNPLFAPLYYRSTLYASSSENGGLRQHILGEPFTWQGGADGSEVILQLNGVEAKPEVQQLPEGIRLSYEGREWEPGLLTIRAGKQAYKIAANQSIMESRFNTLQGGEWKNMLAESFSVNDIINAEELSAESLNDKLNTAVFGKEIWNWFIWAALLFLVIETLVTRLFKAESIS